MRFIYSLLCAVSLGFFAWTATGAEKAGQAEKGLPMNAVKLGGDTGFVTNSMLVTWVVALGLILFDQMAMKNMSRGVPSGLQNFWEWLVESLYEFLEGIIGHQLVKKAFWFFATIFIFILFTNWFGLIPGVGTVGWGVHGPNGFEITRPL